MGLIKLFFRGGRRVQDEEQVLYDPDCDPAEYFRDGNREVYIPDLPYHACFDLDSKVDRQRLLKVFKHAKRGGHFVLRRKFDYDGGIQRKTADRKNWTGSGISPGNVHCMVALGPNAAADPPVPEILAYE